MHASAIKLPAKHVSFRCHVQRPAQRFSHVVKASHLPDFKDLAQYAKAPLAALCAAALLTGAVIPEEAMAARSGGRVGGSSFSSRRAAPAAPRGAAPSSGPTIRNYNYYAPPTVVAPPLVGGFGFPGFFPGFGFGGVAVVPGFGFMGSLFSLFFLVITLSFILNVVKGLFNNKRYDD